MCPTPAARLEASRDRILQPIAVFGLTRLPGVPNQSFLTLLPHHVVHPCSKPIGGSRRRMHAWMAYAHTAPQPQAPLSTNPAMGASASSLGVERVIAGSRLELPAQAFFPVHCGMNRRHFDSRVTCSRSACGDARRPLERATGDSYFWNTRKIFRNGS